jgi:predicted secreted hydrolase
VSLPEDEAPHRDLTEWWYYTGHFHGIDAGGVTRSYGFELTFFQTLRGQFPPYYAAHFAVSDLTRGQFHYADQAAVDGNAALPPVGTRTGFDLRLGSWSMRGLGGHDHLQADMQGYSITIALNGAKPAVLHGGEGIIPYGQVGFSYYYSRPLMLVTGTVSDHGATIHVTGQSWMDHQWGNFVLFAGAGWDWYSMQLGDNTEYLLYVIRDERKRPITVFGTYVDQRGTATELSSADIQIQATGTWTSPHTGGAYPSGWRITIRSQLLTLALDPLLLDQELVTTRSTGVAYWEGAVHIAGRRGGRPIAGEGYVELTGYAFIPPASTGSPLP